MIDQKAFLALPPATRACALVGAYLRSWAIMEAQLNRTLGRALGLSNLQTVVVTRNVQLRDKLHMVKTLLNLEVFNEEERTTHLKTIKRITNLSTDRNTVAHDMFHEDEKADGVTFFAVKAKGNLEFPDIRWSVRAFAEKAEELFELYQNLKNLEHLMGRVNMARILASEKPNALLGGLGLLGPHPLHSQGSPGLGLLSAIPQTDDQTPPASED